MPESHPSPKLIQHVRRLYRDSLEDRFGDRLRKVRFYGSYGRGEAHEESDMMAIRCPVMTRFPGHPG